MSSAMIKWVSGCLAFAGLVLFATSGSYAGRVIISPTAPHFGDNVDLGITSADTSLPPVPTVNLNPGEETTLYVWFRPAFRTGAANDEKYPGYSYNIEASAPGLIATHMTLNPPSLNLDNDPPDYTGPARWTSAVDGVSGGGTTLVSNALALTASGANLGIGNSNSAFAGDGARDGTLATDTSASRSFALGKLVVRADAAAAGHDIGLYLRVGNGGWLVRTGGATLSSPATLQFGNSPGTTSGDQFGQGDAITADLALADAIIHVMGGGPTRQEIIQFEPDPNNTGPTCTFGPPSNTMPLNCVVSPPGPKAHVDARGVQHSFFDVFFDINVDDPAVLQQFANALQQQESDEGINFVRVIPNGENTMGLGIDFDLQLQYSNTPGANRFLDIDASSVPGLVINNIAIPEPSTWALVACGLLGLAMARRRRAA